MQSVRQEVAGASEAVPDLSAMEARLQEHVLNSVRQHLATSSQPGDVDDSMDGFQQETDTRLSRLETGITELRANNQKFEGWFNQMHQTDQQLAAKVDSITQQVDLQGHRVEQINRDLASQVSALQSSVSTIQQDISAGFTRMEALVEKRAKTSS